MLPEHVHPNPKIDAALIERLRINEAVPHRLLHAMPHRTVEATNRLLRYEFDSGALNRVRYWLLRWL